MTEITFVTSNQTKLAHARYLCRNYQVKILSYKKLFYGVGYDEPRIYDRQQLLTASFYDAAARWKKNVSGSEGRIFFIEDTSVKIDALSNDNDEVPGVDVKYWMREISFEKLDNDLKANGNNRRCSVTSHLIVFLTEELKRKTGIKDDYKVFKSTVYGSVTDMEYLFDTNILYPWLDNKTFNKWFVPDGCNRPVSILEIDEAEKGDFRRDAFNQMLSFLRENGVIANKRRIVEQLSFQFYNNFIICGRTCSGKSTIGKHLVDEYGYYHIEASEFMTHKRLETHGSKAKVDKHNFAAKVLRVEPVFVVNCLIDYMHEHKINDRFIITGFRTREEIESFLKRFHSERLSLVFVKSSFDVRFNRWMLRKRDNDNYTRERFKEIDEVQERMGVGEIESMPGMIAVSNDSDGLSDVYREFRGKNLGGIRRDTVSIDKREMTHTRLSLERVILISMALEYRKDQSRWFTTTEISYIVNNYFKSIKRSKNNISRYFNQAFYLYYEVQCQDRKNKYRISPIGYSEAMLTIRNIHHYEEKDSKIKELSREAVNSLMFAFGN